jgi:hypothetical protein
MRWSVPLLAFALFARALSAEACKCSMMTSADVARHAVFAGTAVEYLEREEPPGGSAQWDRDLNAATRFVVEFSREFPSGASVVVMSNHYSNCSAWFQVGGRHLVVAGRVGDVLVGSKCAEMLGSDLKQQVERELHLPADYLARDTRPRPQPLEMCARPATIAQAFAAADAVLWSTTRGACSIAETGEVEIAAEVRWAWKGAVPGDLLHLRVRGHPTLAFDDFEFRFALEQATGRYWPPAELLRREGEILVDDGCLNPHAPASLEAGTEAVKRLFSLPSDYRSRRLPHSDARLPRLSCSTLKQSIFEHSDIAMALARSHAEVPERRRAAPVAQTRGGACAGCALVPRDANWKGELSLLVLAASMSATRRAALLAKRRTAEPAPRQSPPKPQTPTVARATYETSKSKESSSFLVSEDGIEPPTRGFSILRFAAHMGFLRRKRPVVVTSGRPRAMKYVLPSARRRPAGPGGCIYCLYRTAPNLGGPAMSSHEITRTREQLEAQAEALAQEVLHTSADEAWRRLRAGDLEGTLFASKMARLRALLGNDNHDGPLAAAAE